MTEPEFRALYETHVADVYRYCLFRTYSPHDAEDLTAEVFSRLLVRRAGLKPSHARPWLLRVARNLCLDLRSDVERVRPVPSPIMEREPDRVTGFDDVLLWDEVARLSELGQQVVYLRVVEQMSFRQVAAALGKTEAGVKVLFYRCMRLLRYRLEDSEGLALGYAKADR